MPSFGQATAAESRWLKHADIGDGPNAIADVTITGGSMDFYDPEKTQEAYCLHFAEFGKPLGCNITNRRMLQQILGAPDTMDWTDIPSGTRVRLWKEMTSKGTGVRIAPVPADATQVAQQSAPARQQIAQAQQQAAAGPPGAEPPPPTDADAAFFGDETEAPPF